jgi:hypothetical protein
MAFLPPYAPRELVAERLPLIFPEGTPNRPYCIRELAASTVFTALYIGAVEGARRYLGPVHVYRMTVVQAAASGEADRDTYVAAIGKKRPIPGERWYADNTREPIRDETLRDGLVAIGAVVRREDLPTTSGAARYALRADFAALFNPALRDTALDKAIAAFQAKHLSRSALARVSIMLAGAAGRTAGMLVTFPSGETRQLAPGPSSIVSKAVIEVFAKRFLERPAVLWLSESGNKIVMRDDHIAKAIGLQIEPDKSLPDLILADLGPPEPLLVFVEVVATDGAITTRRQQSIRAITDAAGFSRSQVAFLTAYQDRASTGFKRTVTELAWDSFAWFVSEPEHILIMHGARASPGRLAQLLAGRQ